MEHTLPVSCRPGTTRHLRTPSPARRTSLYYYGYVATSSLGLFGEVYDAERVNVNLFPIEEYTPEDYHPENSGIYIHAGDERINVDPEDAAEYGWSPFTLPDDLVLVNSGTLNYWHKIITTELDRVEEGQGFGWRKRTGKHHRKSLSVTMPPFSVYIKQKQ